MQFKGFLSPFYNELVARARVNITKMIGNQEAGTCDANGLYSGWLGHLQRNLTDVSMLGNVYELLCHDHPWPAIFKSITEEEKYYFLSSPETNVTKEFSEIHEWFYVFDDRFGIMFSLILVAYFLLLFITIRGQKIVRKSLWRKPYKPTKLDYISVSFWNTVCVLLKQDYERYRIKCKLSILVATTFTFVMWAIFMGIDATMNTDLVKYSDVEFIDNIHDVIKSNIPIKFATASPVLSTLEASSNSSEDIALTLSYALERANYSLENMRYGGDRPFKPGEDIANHKMITVLHNFPIKILEYFQCVQLSLDQNHIKKEILETRLYKSRNDLLTTHNIYLFSNYASERLKDRIDGIYRKANEYGLYVHENRHGPINIAEGVVGDKFAVASCLNTKFWVEKGQNVFDIGIDHCKQIFIYMSAIMFISFVIYLIEKLHHKLLILFS